MVTLLLDNWRRSKQFACLFPIWLWSSVFSMSAREFKEVCIQTECLWLSPSLSTMHPSVQTWTVLNATAITYQYMTDTSSPDRSVSFEFWVSPLHLPWSRALIGKVIVAHVVSTVLLWNTVHCGVRDRPFLAACEAFEFISDFVFRLSSHLCLGLPSSLFVFIFQHFVCTVIWSVLHVVPRVTLLNSVPVPIPNSQTVYLQH